MQENQNQKQQAQQEKSKILFLISSAIHAKHGIFNSEKRFEQTIETLKSIKNKMNADIIMIDGGHSFPTEDEQAQLSPYIKTFYSYTNEPNMKILQGVDNHDIVKNMSELIMFSLFFNSSKEKIKKDYDRVFKLSARYVLNDEFDLDEHMGQKDKIVIKGPYTTQFNARITGGVVLQYMTRLFSFDANLIDYITETYEKMVHHMSKRIEDGGYIDLEHLCFHYFDPKIVYLIKTMGVEGNLAPNGMGVRE